MSTETKVVISKSKLVAIANSIRGKTGIAGELTADAMASTVDALPTGASDYIDPPVYPTPTVTLTVT